MSRRDALVVFGLVEGYTQEVLKKKYKKLAKVLHPDISGDEEAFKRLKLAYEILSGNTPQSGQSLYTHGSIFTIVR